MLVRRAYIPESLQPGDRAEWPFTVPCVKQLAEEGMTFDRPVTFLVGENGSGKSTVVEAVAEAFGLDARGGRAGRKYGNDRPKTPLGEVLRLETTAAGARMLSGPRLKKRGFFLRAETAFDMTQNLGGVRGYWEEDTSEMSHGESFLTVFSAMFRDPGFYVMDEPEAALSFDSCLRLVALMHQLGQSGAQVVCATHSPILASTPDADIIEIGEHGWRRVTWDDLDLVDHWRRYLNNPRAYLRHFVNGESEQP
ncbi:ABC transporter, ATP-binding protein [Longimycelium tulufanense]|uniref:ABC transporter, ATP-binding protein n=1 Tax=Longimycelium tulufanense TaxID=907463 RepID=A0A8J3CGH4_9PSEU|nr:AAA family ATPase [Longimycelium tulufanense]GGM65337.1 ABC transporter, ATP-binding protein [Longimycelium tulufanense]